MAAGRIFPATAPTRVPKLQPMNGVRMSPYIYRVPTELPWPDATAKISSVFMNDTISRWGVVMVLSSFWEMEMDIRA